MNDVPLHMHFDITTLKSFSDANIIQFHPQFSIFRMFDQQIIVVWLCLPFRRLMKIHEYESKICNRSFADGNEWKFRIEEMNERKAELIEIDRMANEIFSRTTSWRIITFEFEFNLIKDLRKASKKRWKKLLYLPIILENDALVLNGGCGMSSPLPLNS